MIDTKLPLRVRDGKSPTHVLLGGQRPGITIYCIYTEKCRLQKYYPMLLVNGDKIRFMEATETADDSQPPREDESVCMYVVCIYTYSNNVVNNFHALTHTKDNSTTTSV